jgi:hypothetical protein
VADIYLDAVDVHRALSIACKKAGGQKAFAEAQGMSNSYVNDVLNGRRDAGDTILSALGLVRVVRYKKVNPNAKETTA